MVLSTLFGCSGFFGAPLVSADVRPAREVRHGNLQIIENKRDGAAVRQRVIANLGRADELAPPARSPRSSPREPSSPTKCCSSQVLLTNALDGDAKAAVDCGRMKSRADAFGQIRERPGIGAVLDDLLTDREFECLHHDDAGQLTGRRPRADPRSLSFGSLGDQIAASLSPFPRAV